MKRKTPLYLWDDEPTQQRPSGFSDTAFAFAADSAAARRAAHLRRRNGRVGAKSILVFAFAIVAVGAWALHRFAPLLSA